MDPENSLPPSVQPPTRTDSPVAEEPVTVEAVAVGPQEPRLGIMHLLVWTACVAVYFSFLRTASESAQARYIDGPEVFLVLHGLGMGTALAGLVLLVSRRWRGFSLAKHPGEYLLLSCGVNMVFGVVMQGISVVLWSSTQHLLLAVYLASLMARALILLLAAILVRARRWRVFFVLATVTLGFQLLSIAFQLLMPNLGLLGGNFVRLVGNISQLAPQIATVALMVVALMDLFGHKRYPWRHWLGVGLQLWISAITFGSFVYYSLFIRPTF